METMLQIHRDYEERGEQSEIVRRFREASCEGAENVGHGKASEREECFCGGWETGEVSDLEEEEKERGESGRRRRFALFLECLRLLRERLECRGECGVGCGEE
ncbi:MAG: hypothetical protein Q4C60_11285, partial [Eubacteriales bacterium]|nr:hypothetical protein [Eubacteriales bacterium]